MRISDWSSDVCSSDLRSPSRPRNFGATMRLKNILPLHAANTVSPNSSHQITRPRSSGSAGMSTGSGYFASTYWMIALESASRSEEHTSELQSLMRISYAVFCLKKNTHITNSKHNTSHIHMTTTENNT